MTLFQNKNEPQIPFHLRKILIPCVRHWNREYHESWNKTKVIFEFIMRCNLISVPYEDQRGFEVRFRSRKVSSRKHGKS